MKNITYSPELTTFLKKHRILKKFKRYTHENYKGYEGEYTITTFLEAFIWNKTKEGEYYWRKLSDEYEKI